MNKKIKILVIIADRFGVGMFRSIAPHKYIQEHYSDEFDIDMIYELPKDQPLDKFFQQYDIVHMHKGLDRDCKIIKMAQFVGCKVICDIDDHYDLGYDHPLSQTSKRENWKEPIINHLKTADYVSTTTDIFKKTLLKHNKNVVVFPNAIDPTEDQFIPKDIPSNKLRFGIICGSSHLKDIELLNGLVRSLSQDVLDKIQFVLCGFDTNGTQTIYNTETKQVTRRPIHPTESVWYEYEKIITDNYSIVSEPHKRFLHLFMPNSDFPNHNETYRRCWTKNIKEYATHYNNIDVLLVPLKSNEFNKMKSQLKVIEAGFFNKAIIASNFGPYTIDLTNAIDKGGIINPNGNALLVDPSKNHKAWAKYITKLVNDKNLLEQLKTNLHNTVKDKYSLATVCADRVDFYKKIINI